MRRIALENDLSEPTGVHRALPAVYPERVSVPTPIEAESDSGVVAVPRSLASRAWGALLAAWAAFIGALPHVLHHVGPLAGAALLAGAGGRALFAAIGFATAIPFLLRIHRRFKTWIAPAIALGIMAVAFAVSSFVIGPLISGGESDSEPQPGIQQPSDHDEHH